MFSCVQNRSLKGSLGNNNGSSMAVFLDPGPPPNTAQSLLSDTPMSGPGVSSNELTSSIRCV